MLQHIIKAHCEAGVECQDLISNSNLVDMIPLTNLNSKIIQNILDENVLLGTAVFTK